MKIKKQYKEDELVILSINVLNRKGRVVSEVKKYKMDYTVLVGRGEKLTQTYKIKKLPHLFILDRDGIINTSERYLKEEDIKTRLDDLYGKIKKK